MKADIMLPTGGLLRARLAQVHARPTCPTWCSCEKAVEPLGESKPEWEIFGLLARKIQERARARGVSDGARGRMGGERRSLDRSTTAGAHDGKFHESDARAALD